MFDQICQGLFDEWETLVHRKKSHCGGNGSTMDIRSERWIEFGEISKLPLSRFSNIKINLG